MERRTNISERKLRVRPVEKGVNIEKQVFVYEDHRTILNVLDHSRRGTAGMLPLNVVYFDYHSDAANPIADQQLRLLYRNQTPSQEDFWTFVEWRMDTNDGDWLKTGMDLGLIHDAVLIGARHRDNLQGLVTLYTDVAGIDHRIYDVCHIWCALKDNGWLVDASNQVNLKPVWDILGWQVNGGKFSFAQNRGGIRPFVLDFDLDYFTTSGPTGIGQLVWPEEQVLAAFGQTLPEDDFAKPLPRPIDFLQFLTAYCQFITIARESPYCGGYRASAQILEMLDRLIFNGELTATR